MNRDTLIGVAGAAILLAAMVAVFAYESANAPQVTGAEDGGTGGNGDSGTATGEDAFSLTVTLRDPVPGQQSIDPGTIEVPLGTNVTLLVKNDAGAALDHDLVIDGYGVRTQALGPGDEEEITFLADEAGEFAIYCSIGNGSHRTLGMEGTLKVA